MLGFQIQTGGSLVQRAEEKRCHHDAQRMVSPEQGHGDADKSVFRRKTDLKFPGVPQDLPYPNQAGQAARHGKRNDSDVTRINSSSAGGGFALSDGANFETQSRSPQQDPD